VILALAGLVAAPARAQLLAPLLALVVWFAIASWREARTAP
jgi:hypothetical protein